MPSGTRESNSRSSPGQRWVSYSGINFGLIAMWECRGQACSGKLALDAYDSRLLTCPSGQLRRFAMKSLESCQTQPDSTGAFGLVHQVEVFVLFIDIYSTAVHESWSNFLGCISGRHAETRAGPESRKPAEALRKVYVSWKLAEGFMEYVCLCWEWSLWDKEMTKERTRNQVCFEWIVFPFELQPRVCLELVMQAEASKGVLGSVLSCLQPALSSACVCVCACGCGRVKERGLRAFRAAVGNPKGRIPNAHFRGSAVEASRKARPTFPTTCSVVDSQLDQLPRRSTLDSNGASKEASEQARKQ